MSDTDVNGQSEPEHGKSEPELGEAEGARRERCLRARRTAMEQNRGLVRLRGLLTHPPDGRRPGSAKCCRLSGLTLEGRVPVGLISY